MKDCKMCYNYVYDEEYEEYFCCVDIDMDDAEKLMKYDDCPFFRFDNEYKTVNKQI
ncbi:MAG: hypothetical protein IJS61_08595 [Firmicutes bacterium]|nr:hypothetical protein [Bacillota bacterium]